MSRVRDIGELAAELQPAAPGVTREILEEREIEIRKARAGQNVAAGVAARGGPASPR